MSGNQGNRDNASKLLKTVATTAAIGTAIMAGAYLWNNYFDNSANFTDFSGASTSAKSQSSELDDYDIMYQRYINNSMTMSPNISVSKIKYDQKWYNLSIEILELYLSKQQTEITYESKIKIWLELQRILLTISHDFKLFITGSTVTGFCIDKGDLDFVLINEKKTENYFRRQRLKTLSDIVQKLKFSETFKRVLLIEAKVPIINLMVPKYGIEVDISCNTIEGIRNTHLLRSYALLDWRVRPLVVTVKAWARSKGINDSKDNSFSSYTLALMVIHFLQYGVRPAILPCLHTMYPDKFNQKIDVDQINMFCSLKKYDNGNPMQLGELFVNFLNYYRTFDFSKYVISVRVGRTIAIDDVLCHRDSLGFGWCYVYVEEPFTLDNTAYGIHFAEKFDKIKDAFDRSFVTLTSTKNLYSIVI